MKVKAIKTYPNKLFPDITEGSLYEIIKEGRATYTVMCDKGYLHFFNKKYFIDYNLPYDDRFVAVFYPKKISQFNMNGISIILPRIESICTQ